MVLGSKALTKACKNEIIDEKIKNNKIYDCI